MIDVQLLPLHEYVLVLLLFDTNAMLVPDQLVFLLFRIRDSFWAAADSFDAILDAFVDSLRRVIASAHFLYSILYDAAFFCLHHAHNFLIAQRKLVAKKKCLELTPVITFV